MITARASRPFSFGGSVFADLARLTGDWSTAAGSRQVRPSSAPPTGCPPRDLFTMPMIHEYIHACSMTTPDDADNGVCPAPGARADLGVRSSE